VFLTFPQKLMQEPILWKIGQDFEVVTNIRGASITDETALLALLLQGEPPEIDRVLSYLAEKGVTVENLEDEEE
jgi:hypothetical protein